MDASLTVRALTKNYSGSRALKGVDLDVQAGRFVTLLGPSGSDSSSTA